MARSSRTASRHVKKTRRAETSWGLGSSVPMTIRVYCIHIIYTYESRSKLPFTSFSLGGSCYAKVPKIDGGRPKTIGVIHLR